MCLCKLREYNSVDYIEITSIQCDSFPFHFHIAAPPDISEHFTDVTIHSTIIKCFENLVLNWNFSIGNENDKLKISFSIVISFRFDSELNSISGWIKWKLVAID